MKDEEKVVSVLALKSVLGRFTIQREPVYCVVDVGSNITRGVHVPALKEIVKMRMAYTLCSSSRSHHEDERTCGAAVVPRCIYTARPVGRSNCERGRRDRGDGGPLRIL